MDTRKRRAGEFLARVGLISVSVSFALVGVLAFMQALQERGGAKTDRQGALARIADTPWGPSTLVVVALGFAAYATWRLVLAFTGEQIEDREEKSALSRAGNAARGVFYSALAVGTIRLLFDPSSGGSEKATEKQAGSVLDWPGGAYIIGAIGLGFFGAAAFNGYRALTKKYEEKLKMWDIPKERSRMVTVVAGFGLLTRMLMFGIIGWFLLQTALTDDADRVMGMSGALRKVSNQPFGRVLLAVVAVGLLAYAAFRALEARYRKV